MNNWITLLGDLCVVVVDLLLFTQMTALRENEVRNRRILYAGCIVIVACYLLAVFVSLWPASIAALICMTLPSLALFWLLSKYRDARFFLTFCFADTVSLIIGFFIRYVGLLLGDIAGILAIAVTLVAYILIYPKAKIFFRRYREALEVIDHGWKWLTCSAALIYVTMVFCAAYPTPMVERPEYQLPYFVISLMVLSFYIVFLINIDITREVYDQSIRLKEQQKWFHTAYIDALTEIPNRAAYMEKIHELERSKDQSESVAILVMDLDRFKEINDTWGHRSGDEVLKEAADRLSDCFSDEIGTVFRIGGDEFAVIAVGVREDEISEKLKTIGEIQSGDIPCGISFGYSYVDKSEKNAVDQAFARADAMMYAHKRQKTC